MTTNPVACPSFAKEKYRNQDPEDEGTWEMVVVYKKNAQAQGINSLFVSFDGTAEHEATKTPKCYLT